MHAKKKTGMDTAAQEPWALGGKMKKNKSRRRGEIQ